MIADLVRTVVTSGTVLGLTGTMGPLITAASLIDERRADSLIRFYCRRVLASASVRHQAQGLENLPGRSCVLVCNHQSHFDAPLIAAYLDMHVRFVAKAELFKIPIFGQALQAVGTIKVDRSGGEKDRTAMTAAAGAVGRGVSVLFFPEGTRSEEGVLRPFKKGAAVLAIQAQAPLVPMAVAGTKEILPKGSKWVHGGRPAVLLVGEQIPTIGLTFDDRDAVTARARQAVADLLTRAEQAVSHM